MTVKADFNAEEWSRVVQGPPMAGLRVMSAERGGTLRESISMGQAYAEARRQQGASELLDEIVSTPPQLDPRELGSAADLPASAMRGLNEAVAVVREKASPEDLEAYRGFVLELARKVASAKKEGGVLGIGGKPISEAEQAALDEIERTLQATQA